MNNPQMMEMLSNPEALQTHLSMMQMMQSMQGSVGNRSDNINT